MGLPGCMEDLNSALYLKIPNAGICNLADHETKLNLDDLKGFRAAADAIKTLQIDKPLPSVNGIIMFI